MKKNPFYSSFRFFMAVFLTTVLVGCSLPEEKLRDILDEYLSTPPTPKPISNVTVSGQVVNGASVAGVEVSLLSISGDLLASDITDDMGKFSISLMPFNITSGYVLESEGDATSGYTLRALYAGDHLENANLTPLTTLVSELAGQAQDNALSLLERRDAAVKSLEQIGVASSLDDWFEIESTAVNWPQLEQETLSTGLGTWVQRLATALQKPDELDQGLVFGFPQAHGGLLGARIGDDDGRRAKVMAGVAYQEQIRAISYQGDEEYEFTLVESVPGLTVSSEGIINYESSEQSKASVMPFSVQITNKSTGKGRIFRAELEIMETEVIAEGIVGDLRDSPENTSSYEIESSGLADEWLDTVLKMPLFEATTANTKPINVKLLRSRSMDGELHYIVKSPDVGRLSRGALSVPSYVNRGSASWSKQHESDSAFWTTRKTWEALYATLLDGSSRRTNRLKTDVDCPIVIDDTRPLVRCSWKVSSVLQTTCGDDSPCRGKTPVLFIHGYDIQGSGYISPGIGGGEKTWGNFREEIYKEDYAVYEFRWRTNTNLQDASVELAEAIRLIHQDTGKKVHIIAHSIGGILARNYLYNMVNKDLINYSEGVQSFVTIGTPHSGLEGVPLLTHCQQLSCVQAGQVIPSLYTLQDISLPIGSDVVAGADGNIKEISLQDSFGIKEHGAFMDLLQKNIFHTKKIDTLSLIGLTVIKDELGQYKYGKDDDLVSYAGQRFSSSWKDDPIYQEPEGAYSNVREFFLGTKDGSIPDDGLVRAGDSLMGYRHSNITTGSGGGLEAFVIRRDHPAFIQVSKWLKESEPLPVEDDDNNLQVIVHDAETLETIGHADVSFALKNSIVESSQIDRNGGVYLRPSTKYGVFSSVKANSDGSVKIGISSFSKAFDAQFSVKAEGYRPSLIHKHIIPDSEDKRDTTVKIFLSPDKPAISGFSLELYGDFTLPSVLQFGSYTIWKNGNLVRGMQRHKKVYGNIIFELPPGVYEARITDIGTPMIQYPGYVEPENGEVSGLCLARPKELSRCWLSLDGEVPLEDQFLD